MVMRPSLSSPVEMALRTGDEGLIVKALRHSRDDVGQHDRSAVVEEALTLLRTTPSSRVRNAAALVLTDLNADSAGENIIEVLRRPDVAGSSGTLLFALNEIGASIPLSLLVSLVEHGSFEGRAEALIFMEEGRITHVDETGLQTARQTFEKLTGQEGHAEGAEAAQQALVYLDKLRRARRVLRNPPQLPRRNTGFSRDRG